MHTAAEMRQALSNDIPVGMPVKEAQARLEKWGFRVAQTTDGSYGSHLIRAQRGVGAD